MAEKEKKEKKEAIEEKKDEGSVERTGSWLDDDWVYRPIMEMDRLFEELDRNFNRLFSRPLRRRFASTPINRTPLVDFKDKGDKYLVEAELPGLKKEDIEIEVKEDMLTLKGETKQETKEEGEDYLRQERSVRSFYRELPIPADVLTDEAEATFKNGILEISLPKKELKEPEGKKLKVK